MTASPANYDGIKDLVPRENAVIGVLSIGLKRQVLQNWAAANPGYKIPLGRPRGRSAATVPPVVFKGEDRQSPWDSDPARFFIKVNVGQGEAGASPMQRYRPMLTGFEAFNLNGSGDPSGSTSFYGFLAAGELEWIDGPGGEIVSTPYFRRQRKAQKIGRMVSKDRGWPEFERTPDYSPPSGKTPPGGQAECRGNGVSATRWSYGESEWVETPCAGDKCPFARGGTCSITSDLLIHSDERHCGEHALLRYENHAANSTANIEGFFTRLRRELDGFNKVSETPLDGELYGLPVRMQVAMNIKAAGAVRGRQLPARRFPVVTVSEMVNVVTFKVGMRRMLIEAGGSLALPEAQKVLVSAGEEAVSMSDFTPDPPGKPRVLVVPADHSVESTPSEDVIEAELTAEPPDEPKRPEFIGDAKAKEIEKYIVDNFPVGTPWRGLDPKAFTTAKVPTLAELPEDQLPHLRKLIKSRKSK